jgi:hypothetical protein
LRARSVLRVQRENCVQQQTRSCSSKQRGKLRSYFDRIKSLHYYISSSAK